MMNKMAFVDFELDEVMAVSLHLLANGGERLHLYSQDDIHRGSPVWYTQKQKFTVSNTVMELF